MFAEYALNGKVVLITGVSRSAGIGAAVGRAFATSGANVFTTYFRPYDAEQGFSDAKPDAEVILDELRATGVRAEGMEADLADAGVAARLFDRAQAMLGPVDILVNNATIDVAPTDIYTLTPELMDRHYAVNTRGTMLLCRELAIRHDGRPGGRVINLTSGQGLGPMPNDLPYAITKAGVEALTTCLSVSLAPKRITVNAVDPGATDTGWMTPDLHAELSAKAPMGRVGMPEDAARLILFLASDQAQWITGQILRSRGGL